MKVIFLGSGSFAVPVLERLCHAPGPQRLLRAVTRPPRPAGRGRKLRPTPVAQAARALGVPCDAPLSVNDPGYIETLRALAPDLIVVVDYGELLRKPFRDLARIGAFNLHASLLPRHRGAAPVARAILAGERTSGVTLFRIERELDAGPIVGTVALEIGELETAGELLSRLAPLAASLLERHLAAFAAGSFAATAQDHTLATRAPKIEKDEGRIDWTLEPDALARAVRAYNPSPGAHSLLHREGEAPERTVFLRVRPAPAVRPELPPGTVEAVERTGFRVRSGQGAVAVLEIQRAGKSALSAAEYLRGRPLAAGDRFGESGGP